MMELIFFLIIYFPLALLRGWVLTVLWAWYVQPVINYDLELIYAIGWTFVVSLFSDGKSSDWVEKTTEEKIKLIIYAISFPLFMLFFGWIWQLFL